MTANALAFFAAGLLAYAVAEVLTRVFYSMNDTRTPVIAGVSTIALNIVLCGLLVGRYEAAGLALSLSLTTAIEGLILLVVLLTRLGGFDPGFGFWIFRALLPTAAMGLVCAILAEPFADVTAGNTAPVDHPACDVCLCHRPGRRNVSRRLPLYEPGRVRCHV